MQSNKLNLNRASIPELRAKFVLPETSIEEKRQIRRELAKHQQAALKAKRKGKKPTASISSIYQTKVGGRALRGGGCSGR